MKCVLAVVLLVVFASVCAARTVQVTGLTSSFSPEDVTINPGDTVTWSWNDPNVEHNVVQSVSKLNPTPVNNGFNSGDPTTPRTYSLTFNTVGTYYYICVPHYAQGMVGSVRVREASQSSDSSILFPSISLLLLTILSMLLAFY